MFGKTNIFKNISGFLSAIIFLTFILTVLIFPFGYVFSNGYFKAGFYHTILFEFFKLFFPLIQISAVTTFFGYILAKTFSKDLEKVLRISFKLRLIFGTVTVAAGSFFLHLIYNVRRIPDGLSPGVDLFFSLTLILLLGLYFRFSGKLLKNSVTIISVIIFITTTLLFINFMKVRNCNKPNVVFIVVDTLRADHTSMKNPELRTTGYLRNTLLTDSIFFSRGYSNSPWTLPSVSSLITSRYPSQLGIRNLVSKLNDPDFTVAELMRENGYRTGAIISHILLKESYGISQGYDYFNDKNISDEFGNHIAVSSPGVTKDATKFIQSQKNRKFFLFLHYFDPHYIYLDHEQNTEYKGNFRSKDISFLREQVRKNEFTGEDTGYLKYCYDTEIRFTDFYIGKVIEELKKAGIYDNTVIVFTSDHGEEFVERGWLGHSTTLYREQVNVPIIIKPPEETFKKLKLFENIPVSNIDILPTLISMLKLKSVAGMSGKDLLLSDPSDHSFFGEVSQKEFGTDIELVSIVWKNWKMIKDINHNKYELFDIVNDPEESSDLSGKYPRIESKLKLKLHKWIKHNRKHRKTEKIKDKKLTDKEREKLKTLGYIN